MTNARGDSGSRGRARIDQRVLVKLESRESARWESPQQVASRTHVRVSHYPWRFRDGRRSDARGKGHSDHRRTGQTYSVKPDSSASTPRLTPEEKARVGVGPCRLTTGSSLGRIRYLFLGRFAASLRHRPRGCLIVPHEVTSERVRLGVLGTNHRRYVLEHLVDPCIISHPLGDGSIEHSEPTQGDQR